MASRRRLQTRRVVTNSKSSTGFYIQYFTPGGRMTDYFVGHTGYYHYCLNNGVRDRTNSTYFCVCKVSDADRYASKKEAKKVADYLNRKRKDIDDPGRREGIVNVLFSSNMRGSFRVVKVDFSNTSSRITHLA